MMNTYWTPGIGLSWAYSGLVWPIQEYGNSGLVVVVRHNKLNIRKYCVYSIIDKRTAVLKVQQKRPYKFAIIEEWLNVKCIKNNIDNGN